MGTMCGWSSRATASASFWNRTTSAARGELGRPDHLEGHQPVERGLAGLVDDAHAASAQLAKDLVARDDAFWPVDLRPHFPGLSWPRRRTGIDSCHRLDTQAIHGLLVRARES